MKLRQILSAFSALFLAISATSCSPNPSDSPAKEEIPSGAYIESQIPFPNLAGSPILAENTDGMIEAYILSEDRLLERYLVEGEKILPQESSFQELFQPGGPCEQYRPQSLQYDDSGNLHLLVFDPNTDGGMQEQAIYKIETETGDVVRLPIPFQDIGERSAEHFLPLPGGGILLWANNSPIQQFDSGGAFSFSYGESPRHATLYQDTLILVDEFAEDGQTVRYFDTKTGQEIRAIAAPFPVHSSLNIAVTCLKDGTCALASSSGIYTLAPDSEKWEQKADGGITSLSNPQLYFSGLFAAENGDFYICPDWQESNPVLCRYSYSSEAILPSRLLTIDTFRDSPFLRAAAAKMRERDPDLRIQINILWEAGSGLMRDDILKAINTQLVSGSGADLFLLDNMPIESYLEKGVLADLNDILPSGEEEKHYYEPILHTYQRDGKTCAVPLRFQCPLIVGPASLTGQVHSLPELLAQGQPLSDKPVLSPTNYATVFSALFPFCAPSWISEDNTVQADGLASFLELVKELSTAEAGERMSRFPSKPFLLGESQAIINTFPNFDEVNFYRAAAEALGDYCFSAFAGQSEEGHAVYLPHLTVGVNQNAQNMEDAKKLVAFLLSEEMQSVPDENGFPIQRDALQKQLQKTPEELEGYTLYRSADEISIHTEEWLDEPLQAGLLSLFDQLDTCGLSSSELSSLIFDECEGYLSGKTTLENTLPLVTKRLELYLNE